MAATNHLHAVRGGQGPLLLLLHGIGSSGTAWTRQIDSLGWDFSCIAPDLPGYGSSPDPAGEGLDSLVDEIAGALEGRPAHVVGVSFGALSALRMAVRHPALVRSLVLSDATLGRAMLPAADRARWLAHRQQLSGELAGRSRERAAEIAGPGAPPEVVEQIAAHMRRARPAGYLAVARAIAETDARAWLDEVAQPALVICGEHDQVTGLDVSRTLCAQLPGARLVTIAGAGHAPHIEQPEQFAQAVRSFLGALPAA